MSNQPIVYFMVGLPGSGKSTHTLGQIVVSSDKYIEEWAHDQGTTYDEIFHDSIKEASQLFEKDLTLKLEEGITFSIDRTNLTKATRMRYLSKVPDTYKKVAVVANTHPLESFMRMTKRVGKTLPEDKFISMMNAFERPTLEEGFDEIINV